MCTDMTKSMFPRIVQHEFTKRKVQLTVRGRRRNLPGKIVCVLDELGIAHETEVDMRHQHCLGAAACRILLRARLGR